MWLNSWNPAFLLVEFLDELVFGVQDASWPLIRSDLHLTYFQIGLVMSLPGLVANLIEPFLFILGDMWRRRVIILSGGLFFSISLFLTAISRSFVLLLVAQFLFHPASGAYVGLSQASLMDTDTTRHEQNMARWTFAGSLGVFLGPLFLAGMLAITSGWRSAFLLLGGFSILVLSLAFKLIPSPAHPQAEFPSLRAIQDEVVEAFQALRKWTVLRWLILLEFSNLMLDILYGFLALYLVDVAGFDIGMAAFAVSIWTGVGLLGDFLLIPLLERIEGLDYLRISGFLELVLFPAFLVLPQPFVKMVLLALLGFFNSGWYAILKAGLFSSLPERSAAVQAIEDIAGLFGYLMPLLIGLVAQLVGMSAAMWMLLAGPVVICAGLPRGRRDGRDE